MVDCRRRVEMQDKPLFLFCDGADENLKIAKDPASVQWCEDHDVQVYKFRLLRRHTRAQTS